MKVLHLCLSAFFVDDYSYQENILPKYHIKMGYDVTVVASLYTFNKEGKGCFLEHSSEYDDPNGFHVVRLEYKTPIKYNKLLRHYVGFKEVLEREAPDIIFSHNIAFGDISVLVDYLKKHPNVKVYADNHADFVNSAKNFMSKHILHPIIWRYYAQKLQPFLTRCYGVTPMRCRFLKEMYHIDQQKIDFLPMGVDDESIPSDRENVRKQVRTKLGIGNDNILIFTGGKIDRLKNTHILISALSKLHNSNLHLVICGTLTPEMEYLKKYINSMPNIHYMGWCNSEQVMNHMIASDFACFPGTHSTLWEQAVGVGLPSIFKHWNEMEHVDINGNCLLVNGDDYDVVAKSIQDLCSNLDSFKGKASIASSNFLYSIISQRAINN